MMEVVRMVDVKLYSIIIRLNVVQLLYRIYLEVYTGMQ